MAHSYHANLDNLEGGMFSESDGYERFMGRWSRLLAPLFVDFAGVKPGNDVLDVGCGTGALTSAVAAVGDVRVVGIDPSSEFVQAAQRAGAGEQVRFQVADASGLPFPDADFDRTMSMLVLNFVPDPAAALREMIRVTRPNGVVAAAVWDYGDGMEMLRAFWDEAVALDPDANRRDERNMPLCRRGELAALCRDTGLSTVEDATLTVDTTFASFDDFWEPFLCRQGPAGAYVSVLTDSARERLRAGLRDRLASDSAVALAARAWAVRGVVT
jgi:SAM-dependent methyltransferase